MNKYSVVLAKNIISWGGTMSRNTMLLGATQEERARFLLTQLQASNGSFFVEDMYWVYESYLSIKRILIEEYEIIHFNQYTDKDMIQKTIEQMNSKQCLVFMRIDGVHDREVRKQYEMMRESVAEYFLSDKEDSILCMQKPVMWLLDDREWDEHTLLDNVIWLAKVGRPRNVGFLFCFANQYKVNERYYRELYPQCRNAVIYTCHDEEMEVLGIMEYPKKASDEVYVLICGEEMRVEKKI